MLYLAGLTAISLAGFGATILIILKIARDIDAEAKAIRTLHGAELAFTIDRINRPNPNPTEPFPGDTSC